MTGEKVLAVVGATGKQGGGLARAIVDDPESEFACRALTRYPTSEAALALSDRGVEVVQADLDDSDSLARAFAGAHGAYCMTNFFEHFSAEKELQQAANLAAQCGADADSLDRVLRLLAAYGIFVELDGAYGHTEPSRLLRSDHPMSMRAFSRMMGLPVFSASFSRLDHSVRTGSPALEQVAPEGLWPYLQDHPREAEIFGQAMTGKAAADIAAVLGGYDFSRFDTIADIGGGRGHPLRAVLDAVPTTQGILFDLPDVIDAARSTLTG